MSYSRGFSEPYFRGAAPTTTLVPATYQVALDGRPFLLDLVSNEYRHQTYPISNPQSLNSDEVGERSLNPDAGWLRSQSSWHRGAGQERLDDEDSTRTRFRASRGVNVWDRYQLSLLNQTIVVRAGSGQARVLVAGDRVYYADGDTVEYSTDLLSFTDIGVQAGDSPTNDVQSMTTDGDTVWFGMGSGGVHSIHSGIGSAVSLGTDSAGNVFFGKQRLFGTWGKKLFQIDPGTGAQTMILDHPSSSFVFDGGFTEVPQQVYVAGNNGVRGEVFFFRITQEGTDLTAPASAIVLPDGEMVRSLGNYLGFVAIGTSRGVRFALPDDRGFLTLGSVIETSTDVLCFEPQGQYVWFGWTNYDAAHTGLGRIDLTVINNDTPAFASDLMLTGQGVVRGIVTFGTRMLFAVDGTGLVSETVNVPVEEGYLDTGTFAYGLATEKVLTSVALEQSQGQVEVWLSTNGSSYEPVGEGPGPIATRQQRGNYFELRLVLSDNARMWRWTTVAFPVTIATRRITVPLQLSPIDEMLNGSQRQRDMDADLEFLERLHASKKVFTYQEATRGYSTIMTDYTWVPKNVTNDRLNWLGTFVAVLTTVA